MGVISPIGTTAPPPSSDQQLIDKARKRKSAHSVFGAKASFDDLWTVNGDALSLAYPHENVYDASSADAALASHLAYWTENDAGRIERLMRQSALVRNKWDRPDYLPRTIKRAITLTNNTHTLAEGFSLDKFALNNNVSEMEEMLKDDRFIMGRMALMGQSTVMYAKPNTGKTLFTLKLISDAIDSGQVDGQNVYYVNADDNFKGLTNKIKLANKHGFRILSPGYEGFVSEDLPIYLKTLIESKQATDKVLVLDTAKKFVDLMHKRETSTFSTQIREFILNGGTVIMLAHTNKHKDMDGKPIPAGTSDLQDDCDCAYLMENIGDNGNQRHIKFTNIKSRGDMVDTVVYSYDHTVKNSYYKLFDSEQIVDDEQTAKALEQKQLNDRYIENKADIEAIQSVITKGTLKKTEIVAKAAQLSGHSKPKIKRILEEHTGSDIARHQYWTLTVEANNAQLYTLNTGKPPSP